jgi:hypothetical protein
MLTAMNAIDDLIPAAISTSSLTQPMHYSRFF